MQSKAAQSLSNQPRASGPLKRIKTLPSQLHCNDKALLETLYAELVQDKINLTVSSRVTRLHLQNTSTDGSRFFSFASRNDESYKSNCIEHAMGEGRPVTQYTTPPHLLLLEESSVSSLLEHWRLSIRNDELRVLLLVIRSSS
jgi:hypothetical protein